MLKTTPDKIKLNQFYLGGGYGRRSPADMLPEVLPLGAGDAAAGQTDLDPRAGRQIRQDAADDGPQLKRRSMRRATSIGWRHRIVGESVIAYRGGEKALAGAKGFDNIVLEGSKHEYGDPQPVDRLSARETRRWLVGMARHRRGLQQIRHRILHRRTCRNAKGRSGAVSARPARRRAARSSGDQGGRRQIRLGQATSARARAGLFLCQCRRDLCRGGRRDFARFQDGHYPRAPLLGRARSRASCSTPTASWRRPRAT